MAVVSVSLPAEMMRQIDAIQESRGFAGRSELVRAGIRLLLEDTQEKDSLKGKVSALLIVTHNKDDEAPITELKHEFEDIVRTHIHNKVSRANCVELFFVEGGTEQRSVR